MFNLTTTFRIFITSSSFRASGLIAALAFFLCLIAAPNALALTYTVTTNADSGAGSLRQAISDANATVADDVIVFSIPAGSCPAGICTITLTSGELNVNDALTAGALTITNSTGAGNLLISGNNASRVFNLNIGANTTINGVTMTRGNVTGQGGGIRNDQGTLILSNSIVSGNTASNEGGGIFSNGTTTMTNLTISGNSANGFSGGGVFNNSGTLTLNSSTVSGNTAVGSGGGIHNRGGLILNSSTVSGNTAADGGGIRQTQDGASILTNSTVSGNTSQTGGGIYLDSTVTLTGSTVSNNSSNNTGGGINNRGGTLILTNSTVSGNTAGSGGGIYNIRTTTLTNSTVSGNTAGGGGFPVGGGISNLGTLNLTSVTITQNKSISNANCTGCAGGIINSTGTINLQNTIVAGNTVANVSASPDFRGAVAAGSSYNLVGNGLGMTGISNGDADSNQVGVDAKLDPTLKLNGGTTANHALLFSSPAIDKGNSFGLTTDQRGFLRPFDDSGIANAAGGDGSDIGAFEADRFLVVDNTTDNAALTACTAAANDCSLRGAIANANATSTDDGIIFDSTVFASAQTITLTGGELLINNSGSLTITGTGTNLLTISGGTNTVFYGNVNANIAINNLTVTDGKGYAFGGSLGTIGGGIINSGLMTLTNIAVTGNNVPSDGGGIYNNGNLTLSNSTVSGNSSGRVGGGIYNEVFGSGGTITLLNSTVSGNTAAGGGGGIIVNNGSTLNLTDSTVNGNTANSGGSGGILNNGGTINLTASTVSNNTAVGNAGGGGINNLGTMTLTNSTVSGNTGGQGGGIFNNSGSTLNLTNTTIANNTANGGGGIVNGGTAVNTRNTIIAGNIAASSPDFSGILASQGYNLIGNTSGTTITGTTTGNILNQNAQLAPLGNYGGATQTHQLLPGSPAIDQGSAVAGITTDQRGFVRPVDDPLITNAAGGNGSDIGAVEAENFNLVVDNTTDNGTLTACTAAANDCSLRGAIAKANGTTTNEAIFFDTGVFASAQTITLTGGANGELNITGGSGSLTINGTGVNLLMVSGNNQSSIFFVLDGATVNINNLTLTGGRGKNFGGTFGTVGGGIINSGNLTLNNVAVSGNSAANQGGGIFNNGSLTLTNSTVSSNSTNSVASTYGGGICNCQRNTATTIVTNSTISGNSATPGTGGGIYNEIGTVTLTNSTVSNNTASGGGGGIGGGLIGGGNFFGTTNARNTIIAGNSSTFNSDFNGTLTSQGYNLIGNTGIIGATITGDTTGNILNQNALLSPLGNYGGATRTHQLMTGSPAIDKGSAVAGITTDQRGFMRPYDDPAIANAAGGNGSDIGAFEVLAPTAASVTVAGRVIVPNNRGLRNARVILTDGRGATRTAVTTAFGYFNFTDVEAGATYVVEVRSKQFQFSPQVISVVDNIADLNFTAIAGSGGFQIIR